MNNGVAEDLNRTISWQFDKAPSLVAIIEMLKKFCEESTEKFWDNIERDVYNVDTANDWGLSVWCSILGIPYEFPGNLFPWDLREAYEAFGDDKEIVISTNQLRGVPAPYYVRSVVVQDGEYYDQYNDSNHRYYTAQEAVNSSEPIKISFYKEGEEQPTTVTIRRDSIGFVRSAIKAMLKLLASSATAPDYEQFFQDCGMNVVVSEEPTDDTGASYEAPMYLSFEPTDDFSTGMLAFLDKHIPRPAGVDSAVVGGLMFAIPDDENMNSDHTALTEGSALSNPIAGKLDESTFNWNEEHLEVE